MVKSYDIILAIRRSPCRLLRLLNASTKVLFAVLGAGSKIVLDYVIRRFNGSSAELNKLVGLDLRWDNA